MIRSAAGGIGPNERVDEFFPTFLPLLFCINFSVSTFFYSASTFYSVSTFSVSFFILHQLFILYQLFLHQLFLFCISSKESSINFFYSASTLFILHLVERIPHQLCLFCINFFYSASHPKNLASTFFIQHLVPKTLDLVSRINFFVDFEKNSVSQIIAD